MTDPANSETGKTDSATEPPDGLQEVPLQDGGADRPGENHHPSAPIYPSLIVTTDDSKDLTEGDPMLPQQNNGAKLPSSGGDSGYQTLPPDGASVGYQDGTAVVTIQPSPSIGGSSIGGSSMGGRRSPRPPDDTAHTYCGCSIFTFLCCCPPIGLVALFFSCKYFKL